MADLMKEGTFEDGRTFAHELKMELERKGYTKWPDFNKVFECSSKGMTPIETANEVIKNKWWHEGHALTIEIVLKPEPNPRMN